MFISLEDLSVSAGLRPIIESVNLRLSPGKYYIVKGGSGSGKTTLCLALAHALDEEVLDVSGSRSWRRNGARIVDPLTLRKYVGVVLQDPWPQLSGVAKTCWQEVAFGLAIRGIPQDRIYSRTKLSLHRMGLMDLAERLVDELSGGEVQRLLLASFLALDPEILILDEPFAHLDEGGRLELERTLEALRDDGRSALLTTTSLNLPAHLSWDFELHKGRLRLPHYPRSLSVEPLFQREVPPLPPLHPTGKYVLETSRASVRYRSSGFVLSDISFKVEYGQIIGLVGHNGAGKTTTARAIAGLEDLQSGEVLLEGAPVRELNATERAARLGIAFQNPKDQFFCSTVAQEVAATLEMISWPQEHIDNDVRKVLSYLDLVDVATCHPYDLNAAKTRLLGIGVAIASLPSLVILDEPTAALDTKSLATLDSLLSALRRSGRTVIIISHDLRFIEGVADRILQLERGLLVEDRLLGRTALNN